MFYKLHNYRFQVKVTWEAIILVASLIALTLFLQMPLRNRLNALKLEISTHRTQVGQIREMMGNAATVEEGKQNMMEKVQYFEKKFPDEEFDSLNMITELARAQRLTVVLVNSTPRRPLTDQSLQAVVVEGRTLDEILVSIQLKGYFKDFLKYLEVLREEMPAFVTTERFRITRDNPSTYLLNFNVDIKLYLLH